DFDYISKLVQTRSGIVLKSKEYLVEQRLQPICRSEGLTSVAQLVFRMRDPRSTELQTRVVEAIATNETSFFRDVYPFEVLTSTILPELFARRSGNDRVNIWSAACACGQEAYSIAMLLRDHFPGAARHSVRLIASDISSRMIRQAREGVYCQYEIERGLPSLICDKHFRRDGESWRIVPKLAAMVDFRLINLLDPQTSLPQMDVIFLRNVLIYFSDADRRRVLLNIHRLLRPGGYLFLGMSENNLSGQDKFQTVLSDKCSYFRAIA
ncbi:MAG: protein-glutamate O-methyltransferase CheR, partial [Gammaproteobacteria bacterium]|nr:protein-glutamate O-methyltransferase CheR [Gammaproteobacteria bacterium]